MNLIKKLLNTNNLAEQVALIEQLNQDMFSADTLTELSKYLRQHCIKIDGISADAVDVVGTGGDGFDTLNFSTLAAIVAARAGVPITKHGNRSATSRCGSFDLLMRMGVAIPETPEMAKHCFAQDQRVFLFAPYFHPVMAKAAEARNVFKKRGEKTIFNCIGPLINPSFNRRIVTGVFTPKLIEPYIITLKSLGFAHALVFHGDGLDELSLMGATQYGQLCHGEIRFGQLTPTELGLPQCDIDDLIGGDAEQNFTEAMQLLAGNLPGAKTDMVLANAAAVIRVANDFTVSWAEAIKQARSVLGEYHD